MKTEKCMRCQNTPAQFKIVAKWKGRQFTSNYCCGVHCGLPEHPDFVLISKEPL